MANCESSFPEGSKSCSPLMSGINSLVARYAFVGEPPSRHYIFRAPTQDHIAGIFPYTMALCRPHTIHTNTTFEHFVNAVIPRARSSYWDVQYPIGPHDMGVMDIKSPHFVLCGLKSIEIGLIYIQPRNSCTSDKPFE